MYLDIHFLFVVTHQSKKGRRPPPQGPRRPRRRWWRSGTRWRRGASRSGRCPSPPPASRRPCVPSARTSSLAFALSRLENCLYNSWHYRIPPLSPSIILVPEVTKMEFLALILASIIAVSRLILLPPGPRLFELPIEEEGLAAKEVVFVLIGVTESCSNSEGEMVWGRAPPVN